MTARVRCGWLTAIVVARDSALLLGLLALTAPLLLVWVAATRAPRLSALVAGVALGALIAMGFAS